MGSHTSNGTRRTARSRSPAQHPADDELGLLLASGSDARIRFDPATGLNSYHCRPCPWPGEISFSSSTATTISSRAYAAAGAVFRELRRAKSAGRFARVFSRMTDEVRDGIRSQFELAADTAIILSPSGTDAELQALFLAQHLLARPVTSVIIAADETGSGVPAAALGRHFGSTASAGGPVVQGEPIAGLGEAAAIVGIAVRGRDGEPLPAGQIDQEVTRAVAAAAAAGHGVALHVMDHSKLGSRAPSSDCLREVCGRGGVQVIVDACQARLSRGRLHAYLDRGFMVQITGSKFFTGPALSGALLVPRRVHERIGAVGSVPCGLTDYTTRLDWPPAFDQVAAQLPDRANVGQLLRWVGALEEIRAYFAVPELFRRVALTEFAAAAARAIGRYPELTLLEASVAEAGDGEFSARTIFPFTVRRQGVLLSPGETRDLFCALNHDVVGGIPVERGADADVAAALCHIGQPVTVGGPSTTTAALRISADARLVSDCWVGAGDLVSTARLQASLDQIDRVFRKIRLLASQGAASGDSRAAGLAGMAALRGINSTP
jgi:hypothetical protein